MTYFRPAHVWLAALLGGPLCAAAPTFSRGVAPILYKHCVSCHHANDIAPMPLITYKDAKPWAAAIKESVLSRKMPPWKADPHFGKWSNDPSLSAAEIQTLTAWADGGKLEGDPKNLPPPPVFTEGWRAGKPDAIVAIPKFTLSPQGADEYAYITVPTNFAEDRWVVSAELRPGNRKIVHHAHVFVVEEDKLAKLPRYCSRNFSASAVRRSVRYSPGGASSRPGMKRPWAFL